MGLYDLWKCRVTVLDDKGRAYVADVRTMAETFDARRRTDRAGFGSDWPSLVYVSGMQRALPALILASACMQTVLRAGPITCDFYHFGSSRDLIPELCNFFKIMP